MPPPMVNHSRDEPSAQPTISLALLLQVGASPGAPGAAHIVRKLLQALGVAATEHDVVGLECIAQSLDHIEHRLAPLVIAAALAPALADVVLEGAPVLIRHMTDLGR